MNHIDAEREREYPWLMLYTTMEDFAGDAAEIAAQVYSMSGTRQHPEDIQINLEVVQQVMTLYSNILSRRFAARKQAETIRNQQGDTE